jgi:predicted transcriptional regulator
MSTTTIKVDRAIRDRLASVARARGTTMGVLLDAASRQLAAEQQWAEIEAGYERIQRGDPAAWSEYLGELAGWDAASVEPDAAAAEEWPEYNT